MHRDAHLSMSRIGCDWQLEDCLGGVVRIREHGPHHAGQAVFEQPAASARRSLSAACSFRLCHSRTEQAAPQRLAKETRTGQVLLFCPPSMQTITAEPEREHPSASAVCRSSSLSALCTRWM